MVEVEWNGRKFIVYRYGRNFHVDFNSIQYHLKVDAKTPEEAGEKLLRFLDKKFSFTYNGWKRIIDDWNIRSALIGHKPYNYYNPRADYIILGGVRQAYVTYIDENYYITTKLVNPFVDIETINSIVRTMKQHIKIIENVSVGDTCTCYKVFGDHELNMGIDRKTLYAMIDDRIVDLDAEKIILEMYAFV